MTSEPSTSSHLCNKRVALLCCGDFNPPNMGHMRLFERSRDYLEKTLSCQVVEGIICPTSDNKTSLDLIPSKHRLRMIEMTVRRSLWIRCGDYNIRQTGYISELAILKYYEKEIRKKYGSDVIMLYLCGSDSLERISNFKENQLNSLWTQEELIDLLSNHGLIIMKRGKQQPSQIIYLIDALRNNQKNIFIIEDETYPSDISSTRIRRAIRRQESVRYCIDDGVLEYIEEQHLYSIRNSNIGFHDVTISSTATSATTSTSSMKAVIPSNQRSNIINNIFEKVDQSTATDSLSELTSPIWKTPPSSKENSHEPPTTSNVKFSENTQIERRSPTNSQIDNTISDINQEQNDNSRKPPYLKPILSQRQLYEVMMNPPSPALDSPLPNINSSTSVLRKPTILPLPPTCLSNSTSLENSKQFKNLAPIDTNLSTSLNFPPPMGSPNYDNVTLDDLLLASTSWAEYLNEQAQKLQSENRKKIVEDIEQTVPTQCNSGRATPPVNYINSIQNYPNHYTNGKPKTSIIKQTSPMKVKEKDGKIKEEKPKERKKSWFSFNNRSKSLKDSVSFQSPNSDDDSIIRICGTDRREQQQTSPELLWRKVKDFGITKERWSEIANNSSSRKSSAHAILMSNTKSPTKKKSDSRNLRFAHQMTKSAEDLNRINCFEPANGYANNYEDALSRSYYSGMSDECRNISPKSGVTLTFRRYRLTATPETTV